MWTKMQRYSESVGQNFREVSGETRVNMLDANWNGSVSLESKVGLPDPEEQSFEACVMNYIFV